jgi:hypothetical protein
VTVLRGGDPQGAAAGTAVVVRSAGMPSSAAPNPIATEAGILQSPYGVPASAVQHCCGRGCRHCRIYWHRGKT